MKLGFTIPHDIHIRASGNMGFIVHIGCSDFVARDSAALLIGLEEYLSQPAKWEKEYNALPGRNDTIEEVPRPEPPPQPATVTDEARG